MSPSDLGVFVLSTRGAATDEAGGSTVKGNSVSSRTSSVYGCTQSAGRTRGSLRPIPQWVTLEGCTAVEVMAEEASGQCARACGALTRERRACLRRARRACATPLPQGGAKARTARMDNVTS